MPYKDPEVRRRYLAANREKINAQKRIQRLRSPEKEAARGKKWRDANPGACRNLELKRRYGITLEQYNQLLEDQNFRCAICSSPEPSTSKGWAVDHCHETKVVRGILCSHCNTMLGYARDNPAILLAGAQYLGN